MKNIAALILTYNEENIISKCLDALDFVDKIYILDSYSNDNTVKITKKYGAVVRQRKFDNFANQRNAALSIIPNEIDWILMVDADEIVSSDLKNEILEVIKSKNFSMFLIRRKDHFMDKWIKYSSGYPTWFPRLFKNGYVKVSREINEEYETKDNKKFFLNEHLFHYPFNKGLYWWIEKHNLYSEMEAKKMVQEINQPINYLHLFSKDPTKKRKALKRISYKLPFRPKFIFFYLYILRLGFLDGLAGYRFCKLREIYEVMIDIKYAKINE